jgi:hypothetical protein
MRICGFTVIANRPCSFVEQVPCPARGCGDVLEKMNVIGAPPACSGAASGRNDATGAGRPRDSRKF